MTRWAVAAVGGLILAGVATVAVARLLGRSGGRVSVAVSVMTLWLAAFALWSFAGGLAARYGALAWYEPSLFAPVALAGGLWQYRTQVRDGQERGLAVFVGGQLLWLVVVLARNGAFGF